MPSVDLLCAEQVLRIDASICDCMLLTIKDVMHLTGLGRTTVYEELAGPLKSVRVGRRRLVPAEELKAWRAGLKPATSPGIDA